MNTISALRIRVEIEGAVQGVGFRPFVYRLASDLNLAGWVNNSPQGVTLEVEGPFDAVDSFLKRVRTERPPLARIDAMRAERLDRADFSSFTIQPSDLDGIRTTHVLPDAATCSDCLREMLSPGNRRYRYPFTNCTNCGPRFTIIEDLPYDRPLTSMKAFIQCEACQTEYDSPGDRRFHAQPNACPDCGPALALWDESGHALACGDDALLSAAHAVRMGHIVALKGLGGFQLIADARNNAAITRLRALKHRPDKPFAIMVPALSVLQDMCDVSALHEVLLASPQAPIVLLERCTSLGVAPSVAPENPYLGVMLPYTPLHHLLLRELGCPVVATSGNRSSEPLCIDEQAALTELDGLADVFLVHNRPIVRRADDPVIRVMAGQPTLLRSGRGYAPLTIPLHEQVPPLLAVGAHQKNTIAITSGRHAIGSQHIGDLDTAETLYAFEHTIADFINLYDIHPQAIVCDLHPDYASSQYAQRSGLPVILVQHHHAHALACLMDNDLQPPALAVVWDGTGAGTDGTVWGGEFLHITAAGYERRAHLRQFRLPGGDRAVIEPRRSALGLLYALYGDDLPDLPCLTDFTGIERTALLTMLRRKVNAPLTSSAGRLFDAVAALLDLHYTVTFEGQAAMLLEFAAARSGDASLYPYDIQPDGMLDWGPMIHQLLHDRAAGARVNDIAARFHNTLVDMLAATAHHIGETRVLLTGGCFQNAVLLERAVARLRADGLEPYWHHRIPPNDGGIAFGQLMAGIQVLSSRPDTH
jgi:hydrogenase maturation protein HypF